ncbi:YcdB/YcdC domain-containing protein [Sutcliffiella cohnii]|uniref:YcdB/YcdC domain-containing protein n=1 Tax=Sutcliffiella cohnii TaxID=33932 RepID=UPI002E21D48D|nr:DUF4901 domain-containing protein [Sutcliffiella cohnii]
MSEDILKRAKSLIQIPSHWSLIIEDYCQPNESAGYTLLSWADEEQNEGISMQLDPKGRLTKLSQERKEEKTDTKPLSDVDNKIIAEQFLLSHYPDALRALTLNVNEKLENKYRFEYVQFVMNLPLPNSGCFIEVSSTGDILEFHYYGVKKEPATPTNIISKEQVLTEIKRTLDFNLVLSTIYAHTYNVKEQGLQLIYEPNPSVLNYRADVFPPTLTINHEEEIPPQYVTLPQQANLNENKKWSIVELIGITDEMEVIREVDMGEEKGVVWQDRNWEEKDRDRTVEGFISRQTEGTVKAIISKNCSKLNSFIWFKERSGNLSLNREQCLQKAIEFIQKTIPNYREHLLLLAPDISEDEEVRKHESFIFHIKNKNGIPMHLEMLMVVVNCQTGLIDQYSGPSLEVEQLSELPLEPVLSKEEAENLFLSHLDVNLAWTIDYDSKDVDYILTYEACNKKTKTAISGIHAITGEVISYRE